MKLFESNFTMPLPDFVSLTRRSVFAFGFAYVCVDNSARTTHMKVRKVASLAMMNEQSRDGSSNDGVL
jgi:hypothetical protein